MTQDEALTLLHDAYPPEVVAQYVAAADAQDGAAYWTYLTSPAELKADIELFITTLPTEETSNG